MTCSKGMQTKIQSLHSRAAKLVLGRGKFSSSSLALSQLKWHPISYQWKIQLAVMTWKCVNNLSSPYLSNGFQELIVSNSSRRFTRSAVNNNLMVPVFRLEKGRNTFLSRGIKLWNTLPSNIKSAKECYNFKTLVKNYA